MNALPRQITKGLVDHALAIDAALAGKGFGLNLQREMALSAAIIPAMAMVTGAIIDDVEVSGGEGCDEPFFHFSCERAFCHIFSFSMTLGKGERWNAKNFMAE
jgi:hypothetical protein